MRPAPAPVTVEDSATATILLDPAQLLGGGATIANGSKAVGSKQLGLKELPPPPPPQGPATIAR